MFSPHVSDIKIKNTEVVFLNVLAVYFEYKCLNEQHVVYYLAAPS